MKFPVSVSKLLACLLLLLFSTVAFAQVSGSATVDCSGATPGAFTSLVSAIQASPDHTTFLVSGTCTESVNIQHRNDLVFVANPTATIQAPSADSIVLNIGGSQNIQFFQSFTVNGGQGINIFDSAHIILVNIAQHNGTAFGITASNSIVVLQDSSVTANTRTGSHEANWRR